MTTLRQAAEQIIAWYAEGPRPTGDDVVDTLREALDQPERRCEAGVSLQDLWDCWDAVHGGQEPTAWLFTGSKPGERRQFASVDDSVSQTWPTDNGFVWVIEPLYLHPAPIPEGWQLVPIEPTIAMQEAGEGQIDPGYCEESSWNRPIENDESTTIYKAMLAAAPKSGELK